MAVGFVGNQSAISISLTFPFRLEVGASDLWTYNSLEIITEARGAFAGANWLSMPYIEPALVKTKHKNGRVLYIILAENHDLNENAMKASFDYTMGNLEHRLWNAQKKRI